MTARLTRRAGQTQRCVSGGEAYRAEQLSVRRGKTGTTVCGRPGQSPAAPAPSLGQQLRPARDMREVEPRLWVPPPCRFALRGARVKGGRVTLTPGHCLSLSTARRQGSQLAAWEQARPGQPVGQRVRAAAAHRRGRGEQWGVGVRHPPPWRGRHRRGPGCAAAAAASQPNRGSWGEQQRRQRWSGGCGAATCTQGDWQPTVVQRPGQGLGC